MATVNSIGTQNPIQVTFGGTGLATTTVNQILYSSATDVISGLPTVANSLLTTTTSGVPQISSRYIDDGSNLSVGTNAGSPSISGSFNTSLGILAGSTITSGTQNTLIGANADVTSGTLTNATAIGYNAQVSASNSLILGNSARVGIGTSSPNTSSILELASTTGSLLLPRMDDTQRNALTAAAGMVIFDSTTNDMQFYNGATWVSTAGGVGSVTSVTGTTNQIDASPTTGAVTLSIPSTFTAPGSIEATTTIKADTYFQLPATSSTAGVLQINSINVLHSYGSDNIFVGNRSGNFTSSGGGGNSFYGADSGKTLTVGSNNVGLGGSSLTSLDTGYNNTCIGQGSGSIATSANNNIFIGIIAGTSYTTETGNIIIGSQNAGVGGESHVLRIDNGSGAGALTATYIGGINGVSVSGSAVLIDSTTNQLGTIVSSRRYKDNIEDMGSFSDQIYKLRPTIFTMKGDDRIVPGLIAEEVYEIMPELVVLDKERIPQSVKYHEFPALLLNELHKLKKEINDLKLFLNEPKMI